MRKKEGQEWMVVPLPGGAAGGGLVWVHRVKVQVGDNASLQPRRWLGIGTVNWGGVTEPWTRRKSTRWEGEKMRTERTSPGKSDFIRRELRNCHRNLR